MDEGVEVKDILKRRKLWIAERAATTQIDEGDILAGWVLQEDEALTFEGAVVRVPRAVAPAFADLLRTLRDQLARRFPRLGWKKRAGLLCQYATTVADAAASASVPTLVNHDGHPLLFSEARYQLKDPTAALAALARSFESSGPGSFVLLDAKDMVRAECEVEADRLVVRSNSAKRLADARQQVERILAGNARHRADSFEDPTQAIATRNAAARAGESRADEGDDISEDLAEALRDVVLSRFEGWLDEPIPMLGNKTPRQAAKSKRGREKVAHWLIRQEEIFAQNPQTRGIDLDHLWKALGLTRPRP